jgi:branched-subunit amino acid transport protein
MAQRAQVITLSAILLAGLGSYLCRALFIVAMARRRFPPLALRALEHVGPAVLGALVVSMLTSLEGEVMIGVAEAAGLITAILVAWKTRSHIYTLFAAMLVLWLVSGLTTEGNIFL